MLQKSTWSCWKVLMDGPRIFLLRMRIGSTMYGRLFVEVTSRPLRTLRACSVSPPSLYEYPSPGHRRRGKHRHAEDEPRSPSAIFPTVEFSKRAAFDVFRISPPRLRTPFSIESRWRSADYTCQLHDICAHRDFHCAKYGGFWSKQRVARVHCQ